MDTTSFGFLMGGLELLLVAGVSVLGLASTAFWIWMLIDCATKEPDQGNTKAVWILIIVFTYWIGALIYLLARRPDRRRETGR